jgi:hypothetical protein
MSNKSQAIPDAQVETNGSAELEDWELSDDSPQYLLKRDELMMNAISQNSAKVYNEEDNGAEWDDCNLVVDAKLTTEGPVSTEDRESVILILVNLTILSSGKIHNKFDKFSVNDQDAKKIMCNEISSHYSDYANNSKLIMEQTVRHCSDTVWKEALETLREEHKGHYWFPFFPPKKQPGSQS